eukprot:7141252-Pyramimonas_sp.AAC.1
MVRDATAQTYVLHQRAALHALEDFSCGILEVSLDETEMGVEVHGANIKDRRGDAPSGEILQMLPGCLV